MSREVYRAALQTITVCAIFASAGAEASVQSVISGLRNARPSFKKEHLSERPETGYFGGYRALVAC